jgi:hypothetical protein
MLVDGKQEIFQGRTLPFEASGHGLRTTIIERSREHFGTPPEKLTPLRSGPREKRLLAIEKLMSEKGGLQPDSPTAKVQRIIKGERPATACARNRLRWALRTTRRP